MKAKDIINLTDEEVFTCFLRNKDGFSLTWAAHNIRLLAHQVVSAHEYGEHLLRQWDDAKTIANRVVDARGTRKTVRVDDLLEGTMFARKHTD